MNYFIILFTILLSHFSNAQSTSTFFVKNKATDDIKKVYYVGDKVKLVLNNSVYSDSKLKGVINEISIDKIKVDGRWIEISSISSIIGHSYIGIVGMALGAGIWIKGISIPKSSGGGGGFVAIDFSNVKRTGIIMSGVLITATSAILLAIIPKKYSRDKFIFKTYLAP
jgi:hypothetical protein